VEGDTRFSTIVSLLLSRWRATVRPWGTDFWVEQEELLMLSTATNQAAPKAAIWIGRAVSGIVILFLAMDVTMKLANLPVVTEASLQLGW
jgi:hypothetical protein